MNNNKEVTTIAQGGVEKWKERAIYRKQNSKWLGYSGKIALRLIAAMEEIPGMTQKELSKKAGVSPQQVNKIIKGNENLTLQTIAKFSELVGVELISFPDFKYNHLMNVVIDSSSNYVAIFITHIYSTDFDWSFIPFIENSFPMISTENKYIKV